ncbi:hypothetical protein KCA24_26635, partial [Escherichia coli]|nr:hypothetical protein [Escherichia coli]
KPPKALLPWSVFAPGVLPKKPKNHFFSNFPGNKAPTFSTKDGKQGLYFFHALVSILTVPVGGTWKTVSFLFLLPGWRFGALGFDGG